MPLWLYIYLGVGLLVAAICFTMAQAEVRHYRKGSLNRAVYTRTNLVLSIFTIFIWPYGVLLGLVFLISGDSKLGKTLARPYDALGMWMDERVWRPRLRHRRRLIR